MGKGKALRLGVLVSGQGTNLQALIDGISAGRLSAEITVVISNHPDVPALARAQKANVPSRVFQLKDYEHRVHFDEALAEELSKYKVELVVLAGFMHILSKKFLESFPNRIINIHPSLLPENPAADEVALPDGTTSLVFRGANAVERALHAGVKWTGCSIHFVTPDLDRGPVLKRQAVPILSGDTVDSLHARIQEAEHRILPEAIQEYLIRARNGKLKTS